MKNLRIKQKPDELPYICNTFETKRLEDLGLLFFDMSFKAQVETLVQEALEENPSLFLIELSVGGDNSIRVLLDGDEGVSLESCMQVSRKVEHNLDREEMIFPLRLVLAE